MEEKKKRRTSRITIERQMVRTDTVTAIERKRKRNRQNHSIDLIFLWDINTCVFIFMSFDDIFTILNKQNVLCAACSSDLSILCMPVCWRICTSRRNWAVWVLLVNRLILCIMRWVGRHVNLLNRASIWRHNSSFCMHKYLIVFYCVFCFSFFFTRH